MKSVQTNSNVSKTYSDAFTRLNETQKHAVTSTEGPVLVLAGPGTGKTEVLAVRIGNILNSPQQIDASNILCLTFSNAGVSAMKNRLTELIGETATKVKIVTFHSFCKGVLETNAKEIFENRTLISEPHQYMLVEMLISKLLEDEKGFLKPRNEIYFKFIKSVFNTLKQSNISGEDVKGFAKECIENILPREKEYGRANGKGLTKKGEDHKKKIEDFTRQITLLYNGYQAEMEVQKKFDFNDLINETVLLLKQKQDILQSLQEKYQYILVDEFQDTNLKQREVLECLVTGNDQPNLFVVGDDDQCIYKFQGASSANFKWVKDRFKNLETIELGINYRSTTTILNETHNLISNNSDRQPKKKTAIN